MNKLIGCLALAGSLAVTANAMAGASAVQLAQNSWYGPSPRDYYRDDRSGDWAFGTFRGRNGANGSEETITIRADGSAEVRTPGEAPKYGTFAGETLTVGSRISKVTPARGGIVIDGAYYRR